MKTAIRGQRIKLEDLSLGSPFLVSVHLALPKATSMDISCFGLDAANQLSDDRYFIFYNQRTSPEGSISASGSGNGALETFSIDLSRLPGTIKKLVFTATIEGNTAMSEIQSGWVRLLTGGSVALEFPLLGTDFKSEKAVILAEIYWKDCWRFSAVGQGFAGGLSALLKQFGGEEIVAPSKPMAPPPPPPPTPVVPPPPPPISLKKITLEKQGSKKTISLAKSGVPQPIHVNLNWDRVVKRSFFGGNSEADLDLGCMFELVDGRRGVIQALGNSFGHQTQPPYIFLDKDDRSGAASDGENLYLYRPDLLRRVLIFAFIYEGTANFSTVNGRLTLHETDGSETLIRLNAPDPRLTFCAICQILATGTGVEVIKEERYYTGHPDADRQYGFGFNWSKGSK